MSISGGMMTRFLVSALLVFSGAHAVRFGVAGSPNAHAVRFGVAGSPNIVGDLGGLAAEKGPRLPGKMNIAPTSKAAQSWLDTVLHPKWRNLPFGPPVSVTPLIPEGVYQNYSIISLERKLTPKFKWTEMSTSGGPLFHAWDSTGQAAIFSGSWLSNWGGHNRIRASYGGQERFQIVEQHRRTSFSRRYSYRVLKAHSHKPWQHDEVLYTINRDYFGRGWLWQKDEYRIYQGHERDDKLMYYCVWNYDGDTMRCWHSKKEYESGRSSVTVSGISGQKYNPCAVLSRDLSMGVLSWAVNTRYNIFVNAGEDTSLFMALGVTVDLTRNYKQPLPGMIKDMAGVQVNTLGLN